MFKFSFLFFFCLFLIVFSFDSSSLRRKLISKGYIEKQSFFNSAFIKGEETILLENEEEYLNKEFFNKFMELGKKQLQANDSNVEFWAFIPITIGSVMNNAQLTWSSRCFESVTASLSLDSENATLTIQTSKKREVVCDELYVFATRLGGHIELVSKLGKTIYTMPYVSDGMKASVYQYGMGVYVFPEPLEYLAASAFKTLQLFWDPSPNFIEYNKEFLAEKLQWAVQDRPVNYVNLTDDQIENGDYIGVFRADGLDPLIMWGTGSHTGHTAVALWFDDGLHVCESTDTFGLPPMHYWPPPYGVIRTPFQQWIKQAQAADYHVALLRLAPEYSKKFNATAAAKWFNSVQGQPYGYHNFMFSFLDTPNNNLPRPITQDLFAVVAYAWQKLFPIDAQGSFYNMFIQGLNHRLNSNCTDLDCIYSILDPKGWSLLQAGSLPEQDSWRYGGNYSMVCSVFVTELYKNAGIFGDLTNNIQGTEQTPKDTYQMNIYDANWQRPKECVEADPALPYCQLMGRWVLTLPGFNGFPPYSNINEKCQSLPPVYYRQNGC